MGRRRKRRFNFRPDLSGLEDGTKRSIRIVLIFLLAVLSLLSIFDLAGAFGRFFYNVLQIMFGWGFWIFPLVLLAAGYLSIRSTKYSFEQVNWAGMFLIIIGYSGFFHLTQDPEIFKEILSHGVGGGYIGYGIAWPLNQIMGRWASLIITIGLFLIGMLLMFNTSLESMTDKLTLRAIRDKLRGWRTDDGLDEYIEDEDGVVQEEEEDEEVEFEEKEIGDEAQQEPQDDMQEDSEQYEKTTPKRRKVYPRIDLPLNLLNKKTGKPTPEDVKQCRYAIERTLSNFGIDVEMGEESVGPTVTQYTFRPAEGVKLSRIVGLGNDLALALAAHPIRIEAPIPGKSLVGVEVPNKKIAVVPLRQVLESKAFKERKSNLILPLGEDVSGQPWVTDLAKMPHLLVAGATNSGKTVCLNSLIVSLLYQNQPDELKLILVDPKRVEMPGYNGIPHLLTPVITDVKKTINALKWTIAEMDRRLSILHNAHKRNIASYNATHPKDRLPYMVFIIDELADLMNIASAEVEGLVIRLAQMSRAVGIHLILATQRPSVDIITGLIKANIPGRIAFSVASLTDSRTILDMAGAERLLGRGDMLFTSAEISRPKRIQGSFASDNDIERVVQYLRESGEPEYEDAVVEKSEQDFKLGNIIRRQGGVEDEDDDDLLDEARDLVVEAGKASASYLQRRLRVGYARAARLLDLLEERGVVGPAEGSKPRKILVKKGEKGLSERADEIIEKNEIYQEDNNSDKDIASDGRSLEDEGKKNSFEQMPDVQQNDSETDDSNQEVDDFEENDLLDQDSDGDLKQAEQVDDKPRDPQDLDRDKYSF